MSGLFQRIDSLLVQEMMDYTTYDSADMLFDIMGFGKAPDEPVPMADAALAGVTFRAPLMLLGRRARRHHRRLRLPPRRRGRRDSVRHQGRPDRGGHGGGIGIRLHRRHRWPTGTHD